MKKKPNPTTSDGDISPLAQSVVAITELIEELERTGNMTRTEALYWSAIYFGTLYREDNNAPS